MKQARVWLPGTKYTIKYINFARIYYSFWCILIYFDMSFCKESTMPFGAILDCSTSTCLQSSASSSPASSSGTHSTKTRTSFQGFCLDSPFVSSCYNCSRLVFFTTFVVYGFVPTIHWSFMNGFGSDEVRAGSGFLTLWTFFRLVSSYHGCSWCTS